MDFDMLLIAGDAEKNTKSLILKALAVYKRMTNAQLQKLLKNEFSKSVSYQAIRQALSELIEGDVLRKEGKLYSISPLWVIRLKDSVGILEKSVLNHKQIVKVKEGTTQIHLNSLAELGNFVLYNLEYAFLHQKEGEVLLFALDHLWIPFGEIEKREQLAHIFTNNPTKVITRHNLLVDKMLLRWYEESGEVKLGVSFSSTCEYIVYGDQVIQIYMAKELKKKMHSLYGIKSMININLFKELSDMTFNAYDINIIITTNAKIAQQIREMILSKF